MVVGVALTTLVAGLNALFSQLALRAVGVAASLPTVLDGCAELNLAFNPPTPPGQAGSNELIALTIFLGGFGLCRSGPGGMFLFTPPWTAVLITAGGLVGLNAVGLSLTGCRRLAPRRRPERPT